MSKIKLPNTKAQVAASASAQKAPPPSTPTHTPPLFRSIDWVTFVITTLVVFIGYYLTLAPDLGLEDSGELAVGSYYAGIPHPPGYPVWTIYAWIFTVLLPVANIAWRVAVASAFAGALSCGLLAFLVSRGSSMMIEGINDLKDFDRRWENAICVVSGFVAGTLLGFNGFMWSQSVIVEVYSFCVLSLMGVLLFLLRWTYAPHQYRYLCLAFFLHGVCFNNHQSLLVAALGVEVLVLMVQPRMAREMFFWNTVLYLIGLALSPSVLTSNTPVFVIFNVVGLISTGILTWLSFKLKKPISGVLGLAIVVFAVVHHLSYYVKGVHNATLIPVALIWMFGSRCFDAYTALFVEKTRYREWWVALMCGLSWILGAAFYLYMPLAGMSNPPMQWGYPRTVEGFFHAFTRGQYDKIRPTSGSGDTLSEQTISFFVTYGKQMWMYLQGMNDEFNLVYLLIAVVMFFFYRRMQARERAWTLGVTAIFFTLGPLLVVLLNPGLDRQSLSLNRVFFTASHVMVAMSVGYGLTLIAASLATNYNSCRLGAILGSFVALDLALFSIAVQTHTMFGANVGNDPVTTYALLKLVFAILACACLVLVFFRIFFLQTSGHHQFLTILGLSVTGLICLFTTSAAFLNSQNGIEENTAIGFAKILCWLLTGICFYFASRLDDKKGWLVLSGFGALLAFTSITLTLTTLLGNKLSLHNLAVFLSSLGKAFRPDQYALPVHAGLIVLVSTLIFIVGLFLWRNRAPLALTLALLASMPLYSVLSHWADNEQRGHMFGYWFGHDMFTPPFTGTDGKLTYDPQLRKEMMKDPEKAKFIYPEMTKDAILYGGTDPGRFCPTYMIFCESFIPPRCKKDTDPNFDRRDVYIITQNALADGTYLNYIRAHYNRSSQKIRGLDTPFFQELVRGSQEKSENWETNIVARMVSPLDHLFTRVGESIEKNRRAGSSFFKTSDFKDLKAFTAKLRGQSLVSGQVFSALSPETRAMLSSSDEKQLRRALAEDLNRFLEKGLYNDKLLATNWTERWKAVFALESVQNEKRRVAQYQLGPAAMRQAESLELQAKEKIKQIDAELDKLTEQLQSQLNANGVPTSPYLKAFIREAPQSSTRIRLMRLLLEAAYPKEIAISLGGVYPDREMYIASPADSQRCFDEYLSDAQRRLQAGQLKPGEGVSYDTNSGKVQVSGQIAVMAINGLITKVMFDANPENEFFVEESFPLDWMYPHLTPFGVIMKINRQPLPTLTENILQRDHEFWSKFSERLIGNWITYDTPVSNIVAFVEKVYSRHDWSGLTPGQRQFVRDDGAQKAFSKLRSSIGGIYAWRLSGQCPPEYQPKNAAEFQRITKEADFTLRQAFAFCPYSPEAVFRYVNHLLQFSRLDDALLVAETCLKLDPYNGAAVDLVNRLKTFKKDSAQIDEARRRFQTLQEEVDKNPSNFQAGFELANSYMQMQQPAMAEQILDRMLNEPTANAQVAMTVFRAYYQMNKWDKVEATLEKMTNIMSHEPEVWFDLAAVKANTGKAGDSIKTLAQALQLSAQRRATNPQARDLLNETLRDPRFNPIRQLPEFQKLVSPQ